MKKRILPIIFCILLLLTAAMPASAAETGSVTVLFQNNNQSVTDAAFDIYKAAEWDGDEYALIAPFSDYSVQIPNDVYSDEWKTIASTLAAYAERDKITPLASGLTDENGEFSFEGLSDGLYLLVGSPVDSGRQRLFPQPMLVTVPYETPNGDRDYNVEAEPKYEATGNFTGEMITRRALKIWRDDGNEEKRPQNITVQLLCDGKIYDEQMLNTANNWSYTWNGLEAAHDWKLTEKEVPEDYTVQITRQDITFTVTNTSKNSPPPSTGTSDEPTLPQTGLLWWPVPVLGGIGVVALFFGIFLLLRKKDGSDA